MYVIYTCVSYLHWSRCTHWPARYVSQVIADATYYIVLLPLLLRTHALPTTYYLLRIPTYYLLPTVYYYLLNTTHYYLHTTTYILLPTTYYFLLHTPV